MSADSRHFARRALARALAPVGDVLERAVAAGRVPGAVAAVTDRQGLVHEWACGLARSTTNASMRTDTIFRIASMTKPLTSIAVMLLAEEGKLALDDPLAEHVPDFVQPKVLVAFDPDTRAYSVRDAVREVTVRHLLTHTSGFGYWFLNQELLEAKGKFFDAPFLMHDPGERFSYGISTDVLGRIIEPLSGVPLERFLAERVFRPLGLRDTGFELPNDTARLAALHWREASGFGEAQIEKAPEGPRGGGALYSTARDYASLLRMLLNEGRLDDGAQLLAPESVVAMTTNQIGDLFAERQTTAFPERTCDFAFMDGTQKFGLGFLVETRDKPFGRAAGSYSWGGIFNTYFWVDPRAGLGVVLMMQMRPFCDPGCIIVCEELERSVYAALTDAAGRLSVE